jgi:DNA-binding NtrC family response regulator
MGLHAIAQAPALDRIQVCIKCGNPKSLTEFYTHPNCKSGREGKCKECKKRETSRARATQAKKTKEPKDTYSPQISKMRELEIEFSTAIEAIIIDYLNMNNSVVVTAQLLGVSIKTLYRWIDALHIKQQWVVRR